jgi:DNA-binding MarR family transcriptional regulator
MNSIDNNPDHHMPEIDRLIHEPARYNVMALLYVVESAEFLFLQHQTHLTPGNLSSHLSKLEHAGYVEIKKEFIGKVPRTLLALTAQGRTVFEKYRKNMRVILNRLP